MEKKNSEKIIVKKISKTIDRNKDECYTEHR